MAKRNILTSGLISTYPFISSSIFDENGIYIGDAEVKKGQTGKQKSKWFPTNRKQLRHLKRLKSGSMKHMMTSI
jgi:hypothetical protein